MNILSMFLALKVFAISNVTVGDRFFILYSDPIASRLIIFMAYPEL